MKEIYKDIPGLEGLYQASTDGNIRTLRDSKRLKKYSVMSKIKHSLGYLRTRITTGEGKQTFKYNHVLIAITFLGPIPPGHEVNHKDGDKTNNWPDNLEYTTRKGNQIHAALFGLFGNEGNFRLKNPRPRRILKKDDIPLIRDLFYHGWSRSLIADVYSVNYNVIAQIISRITWRHV